MSQNNQEINEISSSFIPEAFNAMNTASQELNKVAEYCKAGQKSIDYNNIYNETQNYSKNSLYHSAYHVYVLSIHLTRFIRLQTDEIEEIGIQISSITDVCVF